ncbi:Ig-like domain repeat protein [Microbacterium sp. X-17]|uniref:Ig-like domain repeat protein n=1 Tax=Microbacterium sp. X-17 TaxID=3144404 RepID=UPI0031F4B6DD
MTQVKKWHGAVRVGLVALLASALTIPGTVAAQAIDAPAGYTNQTVWDNYIAPAVQDGSVLDLGDLIVTLKPGAKASDLYPIASVSTAPGALPAPTGYNVQGVELYILDNTYTVQSDAYQRGDAKAAGRGLDGGPIAYSDSESNHIVGVEKLSANPGYTESGYFRYALTLSSDPDVSRPNQAGVAFYDAILFWDKATDLLSVVSDPGQAQKAETQLAASASGVTSTSATLSAGVTPAAATGTVTFTSGSLSRSATVTNGTASVSVSGLTPSTPYTFSVAYSGDEHYLASSAATTVTTSAASPNTSETPVGVTVPDVSAPKGLQLSVPGAAITLAGTARTSGQAWQATGALGTVTVNDDRRNENAGPWTLSGRLSTLTAEGSKSIAASNLGWKPAKVDEGNGTAGAEVVAGSGGGLSADKPLATGTASAASDVITKVGAAITLNAPANTPAGTYAGTLTLTLI